MKTHKNEIVGRFRKLAAVSRQWVQSVENGQNPDVQFLLGNKDKFSVICKYPYAVAFQKTTIDRFTQIHQELLVRAPHAARAFKREYDRTVDDLRRLSNPSGDSMLDWAILGAVEVFANSCENFAGAFEAEQGDKPETDELPDDIGEGEPKAKDHGKTRNRVPWNPNDPAFYTNTEAIDDAHSVGEDREIDSLKKLNPGRLNKLLRSPGCGVRFMSAEKPLQPRGKVHRDDWKAYLKSQISVSDKIELQVEQKVQERLS